MQVPTHLIPGMVETGAQGLSLDSKVDFPSVAATLPEEVVLMGNIDTSLFYLGSAEEVYAATTGLLEKMAPYKNFILSSACDIPPRTRHENINAFMMAGRKFS